MDVRSYLDRTADGGRRTRDYRQLVEQYYEGVTPFYQRGWGDCFHFAPFVGGEAVNEALAAQHRRLIAAAQIEAGMKVLDVGCGIGGPARSIARASGAEVTGVTIAPIQVAQAQRLTARAGLAQRCRFELGDAMALRFADGVFDAVVTIEAGCHMPDKARLFAECARVLRRGGTLAGWDWIRAGALDDRAMARHIEPICRYFALPHLASLSEIGAHVEAAGLELQQLEDLDDTSAPRRWWWPLERQLSRPLARIASRLSRTLGMMRRSGELLVDAAEAGAFSALGFFVARKP